MKDIISTLIVAIIVINNLFGTSTQNKQYSSQRSNILATIHANTNKYISHNNPEHRYSDLDSSGVPLQCNDSPTLTYYLGPVIPERIKVVNPATRSWNTMTGNGVSGIYSTDYYIGAIFNYEIINGTYNSWASRDDLKHTNAINLWRASTDFWGYQGASSSGKYCSVTPHLGQTSSEICSLVCPNCSSIDPPGNDGGALSCDGDPALCLNGGQETAMAFRIAGGPPHADFAIIAYFDNIQFVYYGIPKSLPPRSKLSDNQPKNTSNGDKRDCDVSRCEENRSGAGDPIDVLTGNFDYSYTDMSLNTIAGELSLQRSYASQATNTNLYPTDISPGWTHNQDSRLLFEGYQVWFKGHTINQYRFDVVGDHLYDPYNGVLAELVYDNGQYLLTTTSHSVYRFDDGGRLMNWTNERGFGFNYSYSGGKLERVTEPISGRYLQFDYLGDVLQSASDNTGRQVTYAYDRNGDLTVVTDVRGNNWEYSYNDDHQIITIFAPGMQPEVLLTITYDDQGRAYEQYDGVGIQLTHIDFNNDGSSTNTDATGVPTNYTPDCRGVITRIETPSLGSVSGYFIDRGYDHNFNLTSLRGEDDETATQFRWSTNGANLLGMTDQAGFKTIFTYDTENHLTRVEAPENEWQDFVYNGPLLESSTKSSSLGDITTNYAYTSSANSPQPINLIKSITDALHHQTNFTYDALGQLITIIDADLYETHFTYNATGQVTTITDALGRITLFEYDFSGAVTKIVQNYDPDRLPNEDNQYNLSTTYVYDLQGRLEMVKDTNNITATTTVYDHSGRIYQLLDALNNPTTYTYNEDSTLDTVLTAPDYLTSYEYDEMGRVTGIRDSLGHLITAYTYNADGTVAYEKDGAGLISSFSYDALHRIIQVSDNAGHVVSTTYNNYGNITSITDALGRVTQYKYDDPGRLTAVTENYLSKLPSGYDINSTNIRTEYHYDLLGNLRMITDADGHETTNTYDNLYRLKSVTDPLGHITSFTYDALGNKKTLTLPNMTVTQFDYDLVNRLTNIDYPGGTNTEISYQYNELNQLTGMDDMLGHTTWTYTLLGQPEMITDPFNRAVAYKYNTLGNRIRLTYPGGRMVNYIYNADGLIEQVMDGTAPLVTYSYDTADRLDSEAYANDLISSYTYDLSSQITGIRHQLNGRDLSVYAYTYDVAGNLTQTEETSRYPNTTFLPEINNYGAYPSPPSPFKTTDSFWEKIDRHLDRLFGPTSVSAMSAQYGLDPDQTITYDYDALDRLKSASYSTGIDYTYSYDKVGNRTSQTINGNIKTYKYDVANRLSSVNGVNYTWNNNGSLINNGLMSFTYDPSGRLASITSELGNYTFGYDGLGNRYTQTAGGDTAVYTLDLAAGLTTVLREGSTTYLYGLGLIGQEISGEIEYALDDRLGSIRQLVTENQQVSLLKSYDPFGNPLLNQGTSSSSFSFIGEHMDNSGLEYLRARYYDPETGRFITADPYPGALSLPATQNAYTYVINNPLSYTDPSGEILPFLAAGIAGGLIGGGMSMVEQCISSNNIQACMKCLDWNKVGTAAAAGAVAGFVGFGIGLIGGVLGAGIIPTVTTGLITGMITGQVYRMTELALSGNWDQAGRLLFQPEDILLDGVLGAASSAVGLGVGKLFSSAIKKINTTINNNTTFASNYKLIEFQGRRIYQLNDIDWNYIDPATGWSNREITACGNAPFGLDGKRIHLHHLLQQEPGPLVEINASVHSRGQKVLHGLISDGQSYKNIPGIMYQYSKFRAEYWIWRSLSIQ
jgi:RHS repeat-associated protein